MFTSAATCQGRRNVDRCSSMSTDDSPDRDVAANRWVWYQPSSFSPMPRSSSWWLTRKNDSPVKVKLSIEAPVRSAGSTAVTWTR